MSREDIRRSPGDFLYAFLSDDDILSIARVMGVTAADTIQNKRLNQIKLLKGAYNGTPDYSELGGWIKDAYGYTPQEVFLKLVSGESVAGKDWKRGVYGVGATPRSNYNDGSSYAVDPKTGKLTKDGGVLSGGVPIFTNGSGGTFISGYSYMLNGRSYTSKLGDDGSFYANTYGTDSGAWFADGSVYTVSKGSNFWEGLGTYFPLIKSIISWLISAIVKLFGSSKSDNGTTITTENTVPKQEEFMVESSRGSMLPVMALAFVGGYLLLSGQKKKNGKK